MTQRGDTQINVFTKGLITESNPLNFPVDAAVDVINMHLKRNGTMERRLGMDFEDSYVLTSTGLSSNVLAGARVTAYRWSIPNGQSEVDIGVIQIGNSLYFLDLYAVAPSAVLLNGGVPVTAVGTSNDQIMSFATINNYLVAVSNALADPYLFSYDADTDVVSWETAPILIRDLYGVDDGLGINERPTVLTPEHTYNLKNQGWNDDVKTTCGAGINAIDCTFNTFGVYPSNSDIWSLGRIEDLTSADVYKFDPNLAARNLVQIGQASRGHFIIPIFGRGQARQDLTGLTLPADRETGAITYVASYAGRVFYAGILSRVVDGDDNSPSFSGTVFFSQVFTNKDNLIKCYQEADPTSPEINDMIDTDGGTIQIPGCNYIYALIPTKTSLFVFGANGVWEIRGDEGGFRATSFQVNKISNVGVYAPKSIVEINNTFIFWGDSGIYTLSPNEFGLWNTENITLNTIQRFFNALPDSSKKNARGYHDLHTNTARWLYYSPNTKQLGNPIDSDIPGSVTQPFSVGTPISLAFVGSPTHDDCQVLTSTRYVVVVSTLDGANRDMYAAFVDVGTNNTVITAQTPIVIDNSVIRNWGFLSIAVISETQFVILAQTFSGAPIKLYGIVCNVSGDTITAGAPQYLADLNTNSIEVRAHKRDTRSDQIVIAYYTTGAAPAGRMAVVTISGTTLTLGAPTTIPTGGFDFQKVDFTNTYVNDVYRVFHFNTGGNYVNSTATVSGTDTVTISNTSGTLNMYSGSTLNTICTLNSSNMFANVGQNIFGTGSARLVLINGATNNIPVNVLTTTETRQVNAFDIAAATSNRLFYLFGTSEATVAARQLGLHMYTYDGVSSLPLTYSTFIETADLVTRSLHISSRGFSPTKAPLAYIATNFGGGGVPVVRTLVYEAGAA